MDEPSASVSRSLLLPSSHGKYSVQEAALPSDDDADSRSQLFYYPWEIRTLPRGTSSAFGAVFIIVNAALGAGLLAFPQAFYNAGGVTYGVLIEVVSCVHMSGVALASSVVIKIVCEVSSFQGYLFSTNAVGLTHHGPIKGVFLFL